MKNIRQKNFKPLAIVLTMLLGTQTLFAYEDTRKEEQGMHKPQKNTEHNKGDRSSRVLDRFDKNKDNKISYAEAPDKMQKRFKHHDLNSDGFIEGKEFDTLPKHPRKPKQENKNKSH